MGFIPSKENVLTYWRIIQEASPKSEIFKYIGRRMIGTRKNFDTNVLIKNKLGVLNCGNLMINCTVACSEFEKELLPLLTNTKVAIDIGANIGKHTIVMAQTGKKVFAVEPDRGSIELLKQNIKLNNMDNKITIIPTACGKEKGTATFYRDPLFPVTNSITIKKEKRMTEEMVNVDTVDNICKGEDVDLIKVDVEGGELNVLKGAKNIVEKCKPRIIFEAWNKEAVNNIMDYLSSFGYTYTQVDEFNYLAEAKA